MFDRNSREEAELPEFHTLLDLVPLERGLSGRITAPAVEYRSPDLTHHRKLVLDQHAIRDALSDSFLYSSAFVPRIDRDADGVPIRVSLVGAGWGHGAGFCQLGGLGMALGGFDASAILAHYFQGASPGRVYG